MITALALIGTLCLGALGLFWLLRPQHALTHAGHRAETLPQVMGGRYLAMAALWGLGFAAGHGREIGLIFAALGALDAYLYRHAKPLPHLGAGALALLGAALAHLYG